MALDKDTKYYLLNGKTLKGKVLKLVHHQNQTFFQRKLPDGFLKNDSSEKHP